MNILIVTQYFWPETFTLNDLVKTLKNLGHQVVVATGKPNYPEGKIFNGYSASGVQRELFEGDIEVFRVPLRPRGKGALNLFLNYFSFIWSGLRWFPSLLQKYKFDAIVVWASSPITSAIPAIPLKFFKKAHLAIWVQDLWPESLEATGYIRSKVILKLVGWLVRSIYSTANTILVQSHAFKAPVARYARREKIIYYPLSLDFSKTSDDKILLESPELLNILKTYFCVVFAGNIGTAQAVETLVETAVLLKEISDIKIVLVGSGSMSEWVQQKKEDLQLTNLILAGRFPMSSMPEIYRHAGCLVVTLKNKEIFSYTIPGKVQAYLAAGKPIIASLNGEGARIITEAKAGLTCPSEDPVALKNCILSLFNMTESERVELGNSGKLYFLEHFEMRRQAVRLMEIIEKRLTKEKSEVIER